jgi:hypothetical protein
MSKRYAIKISSEEYDRMRLWLAVRHGKQSAQDIFNVAAWFVPDGVNGLVVSVEYNMHLLHGYLATCGSFLFLPASTFGKIMLGEPTDPPKKD